MLRLLLCLLASCTPLMAFQPALPASATEQPPVDPANPWYPTASFPRLLTPDWVGEPGVEAVVVLAIDDMRDPAKYEVALRPILNRLKQIDGRAPVSIMTNDVKPDDPQLQSWLEEGLSIECHSTDHPCPLLQGGDFAKARSTYERCVDRMASIPGNRPVAFRTPCCDSLNTVSPSFYDGIFSRTTPEGRFLQIDSSVFMFFTGRDPELPRERLLDSSGHERFLKYLPKGNRFGGNVHDHFVNFVENYPYPWVINGVCWQIPCLAPSDWSAQHLQGKNNPVTVDDWKAAIDLTVAKRGCFSLVFHPHGWIQAEQIVELINHAVTVHGPKVRFLNFRETADRLNKAYCGGKTLREQPPEFLRQMQAARQSSPSPFAGLPETDAALLTEVAANPAAFGYPAARREDGTSNGFFIHDGHFCWQNEHTSGRPDLLQRESFPAVLTRATREKARASLPLVPVGAATVDITPDYPVRLTGYGNRMQEAETAAVRIHARALAIGPKDDLQAVLLTVDNCGIPAEMTEAIYRGLAERLGTRLPRERFAISATHSHSAPWLRGFAPNIFATVPEDHAARLARYETELTEKLVQVALQACGNQRDAALSLGFGEAGFAMNRRVIQQGRWSGFGETPDGPVDKRVPLLAAHDRDGKLIALLANYACHCTTETGDFNQISGDWAGFAADYLETEYPGAVALIAIGCGADANPSPRGTHEMARQHGRTLANEVQRLLPSLRRISPKITARLARIDLPLAGVPDEATLQQQAEQPGVAGSRARWFLEQLRQNVPVPTTVPGYPVQTWCFGDDLAMVFLGGEVVVDYALRMNDMFDGGRLWINAYSNDVPCYIASARLLREGGYEVDSSMLYYRRPSSLAPETEDLICDTVQKLLPHEFYSASLQRDFPAPLNPASAVTSLQTRPGMQPVLAAAEPLIRDPVAFDWDERGRLWVVEMGDYPLDRPRGRIRVLTDRDGDWRYDEAVTFLDELAFPSGIQCWRNGVIISMAPQVFYAEDTDGDGACDHRQPLYAGFIEGNQQHRVNGLRWGLDGWLYLANGDSGGLAAGTGELPGATERITPPGQPVILRGRDLRIHPDSNQADAVSGTTQFARERDDFGRWFGNNNSNPIWQFTLEDRYLRRNPHAGIPGGVQQIAETPGAAPVFPASRTLARFNDFAFSNRFTSACGTMIYRDVLLGNDFAGNAFTSEPVHNLVSRLVLKPAEPGDGHQLAGRRAADEQDREFLASTDNWFRPTMLRTGPDGAIWVADMYRAVIEHPEWIPAEYQRKMNLSAGNDRGRIYRILPAAECCGSDSTPEKSALREPFPAKWNEIPLADLANRMASPNGWWRDLAHRLLLHRRSEITSAATTSVLEILKDTVATGNAPAVQALAAFCQLLPDDDTAARLQQLESALASSDAEVRRMAVELLEPLLASDSPSPVALQLLAHAASDPAVLVQRQVLLSCGEVRTAAAAPILARLLLQHSTHDSLRKAAFTSLHPQNIGSVLQQVLQSPAVAAQAAVVSQLMSQAGAMGAAADLSTPLTSLLQTLDAGSPADSWQQIAAVLVSVSSGDSSKQLVGSGGQGFTAALTRAAGTAWAVASNDALADDQRAAAMAF
ncbi:MAG: neutral/alkaline non-lysosomal ceramidase N-terminal domain-containing protein, partial [Planctomycetota bacterium]